MFDVIFQTDSNEFDGQSWINDLAAQLEKLAPEAKYGVKCDVDIGYGYSQPSTQYMDYEELLTRTKDGANGLEGNPELLVRLDEDPVAAIAVLKVHPVIQAAMQSGGDPAAIQFVHPRGAFMVEFGSLVSNLVKASVKSTAERAAAKLHQFLNQGSDKDLDAIEFTLLDGLKLDYRIEISDGTYLAPYRLLKEQCDFTRNQFERVTSSSVGQVNSQAVPKGETPVLVRKLTWGPAIASAHSETEDSQIKSQCDIKYESANEAIPRFWRSSEIDLIVDMLLVACRTKVVPRSRIIRVDDWVADLDPNFELDPLIGRNVTRTRGLPTEIDEHSESVFESLIGAWKDQIKNRPKIEQVVRRLSIANSRSGRYSATDRVVDTSIVLEMMFVEDGNQGEITYKLKTRAAYYLGCNASDRTRVWDQLQRLYKTRSAIVHRGEGDDDLEQVARNGYKLAVRSLLKLAGESGTPNWKSVVLQAD